MRGTRQIAAFCAFAALWICSSAHAATVRAWLDRTSAQLGETVTLNVEVSGDSGAAQPDLSALAADFDLLGTQSSSSYNFINGQSSSKVLWAVGLSPKHEGTLTIPALTVAGQRTSPLTLTVQPATAGGTNGGDVYVEATVEPRAPYVQQQLRLSVKLYYALNLVDGNLGDPQGDGLIVRKLGQDSNYNANVGGRNYHVVERRYAVFPEKSGPLTVPGVPFRGHVVDGSSLDIFFNRGREVSARSQPIALDVRPRPAASGSDAWLPARSLTLTAAGIDAASTVRAGEPITLTLKMQAQGLGFEQLPELKLPAIDGVDIYPDKSTTQNRDDGEWLFGERERKFAIVPNRAGTLTLPAISVGWWDTAHDRAETATIPALTLDVQPAAAASAAAPKPALPAAPSSTAEMQSAPAAPITANVNDDAARWWRAVALAAVGLWVLTLLVTAYILRRRRASPLPPVTERDAAPRKRFAQACAREDFAEIARALLDWARQQRPELRNLGAAAAVIADPAQREAIAALERARFGNTAPAGLATTLQKAFAQGPVFTAAPTAQAAATPLPALYPFDL